MILMARMREGDNRMKSVIFNKVLNEKEEYDVIVYHFIIIVMSHLNIYLKCADSFFKDVKEKPRN